MMAHILALCFLLLCAVASTNAKTHSNGVNILVMGDWGGQPTAPYYTEGEKKTAEQMGKLAGKLSPSPVFALGLGDNFYYNGVTDINDPRFKQTFEDVFTSKHLLDLPFYFFAGNHDHHGNVSAEIAYSHISSRWNFPDLYYTFSQDIGDGKVLQFIMIDTVVLAGDSDDEHGKPLSGLDYPGPADMQLAETQLQWIENELAKSTADYLVVGGHYPVWSICEHGPTGFLVDNLKPLLEKYHVTAYLAGHDHCSEHIRDPLDKAEVDYHGIGAAHDLDDSEAHKDKIPHDSLLFHYGEGHGGYGGFASLFVNSTAFIIRHYADDGSLLYTTPNHKPRS